MALISHRKFGKQTYYLNHLFECPAFLTQTVYEEVIMTRLFSYVEIFMTKLYIGFRAGQQIDVYFSDFFFVLPF